MPKCHKNTRISLKKNVTFDFLVLGCWKSIGNKPSIMCRSSLNSSMIGSRTKKLLFFYGEILPIFSNFAHISLIYLHRKKNQVWKKILQLILFVELCSEMSSRIIFWPNKSICTLIWIPSKYTQMSVNLNHYLEPCLNFIISKFISTFAI